MKFPASLYPRFAPAAYKSRNLATSVDRGSKRNNGNWRMQKGSKHEKRKMKKIEKKKTRK